MKFVLILFCVLPISTFAVGQGFDMKWYSESTADGITIQNSFPKGGPYTGEAANKFNCSYLVFFSRFFNGTDEPIALSLHFSADSIAIPNSPNNYVKLLLPADTMTLAKQKLSSYGITELGALDMPTSIKKQLNPNEDCFIYTVALFYQTEAGEWSQERGGNRAEIVLNGQSLYYRMPPQVPSLLFGNWIPLAD